MKTLVRVLCLASLVVVSAFGQRGGMHGGGFGGMHGGGFGGMHGGGFGGIRGGGLDRLHGRFGPGFHGGFGHGFGGSRLGSCFGAGRSGYTVSSPESIVLRRVSAARSLDPGLGPSA